MTTLHLRVGFMPLVDCALVVLAKDEGFAEAEGLNLELVREVSWSNVRDKLNIGLFDAAHLLAPVAIASSLGLGHVKVPIITALQVVWSLRSFSRAQTVSSDVPVREMATTSVLMRES